MRAKVILFSLTGLVVLGCGGAGTPFVDDNFDRSVIGVWEPVQVESLQKTLTINLDGTYRYQYASVDQTRGYTYNEPTLVLEDNVITSPDTYTVSFPARDRMRWTIDYLDFQSTMDWQRVGVAPN